jgi:hypothetical protein
MKKAYGLWHKRNRQAKEKKKKATSLLRPFKCQNEPLPWRNKINKGTAYLAF